MEYKLVVTVYTTGSKKVVKTGEFGAVSEAAHVASAVAEMLWTRHNGVSGVVRHLDKYFDLYNEGSVVIESV